MANFNYKITCPSADVAQCIGANILNIDIYLDGLDVQDEEVTVISKQTLTDEICVMSMNDKIDLMVEVWPEDMEYDEAEMTNNINEYNFEDEEWSD
jgi:hypothetical protein